MKAYPKVYLYQRIVQAKCFIDRNFDAPIALNQLANEACFSKFHFIRVFKKIYGKSPYQYLMHVRIEHARQMLKSGLPVAQVCFAIGFESISSFSGLFRKIAGISPAAFQQQQMLMRRQMIQNPLQFIPGCFARNLK